jgi:hypothetical protein
VGRVRAFLLRDRGGAQVRFRISYFFHFSFHWRARVRFCVFTFFREFESRRTEKAKTIDGDFKMGEQFRFEAIDQLKRPGFVGEAFEREGLERKVRLVGVGEPLAGDFPIHNGCFESDDLAEMSVSLDYALDETLAGEVGGVTGRIFSFEADAECGCGFRDAGGNVLRFNGLRIQAVTSAVARGFAFAGGCDGSAGSGAIQAGSFDLACSSHFALQLHVGRRIAGEFQAYCLCFVWSRGEK